MTSYERIIHQQALREAEGYIDLAMGFADQWPLDLPRCVTLGTRALRALKRLGDRATRKPHALYLTGQAYRVMQRYDEAVKPLSEAAKRDPEDIMTWLAIAWCYKRINRLDLAIESLENALAIDSDEAILHYNLACYWSLAGNSKIALRYLSQSLDIDPSFRELIADEEDFDPVRDLPDFQSILDGVSGSQLL